MSISITSSFITSLMKLDKKVQKYSLATISALEHNAQNESMKIHKLDNCKCDDRFRSARVNDDVRIIFANRGNGDKALLYVDHHEEAYRWCEGKFLERTNFGADMIFDEKMAVQVATQLSQEMKTAAFYSEVQPLLASHDIKPKHLEKLGVPGIHAKNLLAISDSDIYLDYVQIFPEELQEALLSLAIGEKSFDVIYNELLDNDFSSGVTEEHKDTKRRFYMLQSLEELENLLNSGDFEAWTVFLHPSQEKLVRMNFNGPALIEGGPGTGKTVVGIHRAIHLIQNVFTEDTQRVLFCTFSKKLSRSIRGKLELLAKQKNVSVDRIDVMSVDAYFYSIYQDVFHKKPVLNDSGIRTLLSETYNKFKPKSGSYNFYLYEYSEIIEKYHITSLAEYLELNRVGGQVPLSPNQRRIAWEFFEIFLREKEEKELMSFVDMAHAIHGAFESGTITKKYDSVIIDEAQDLEAIKLRVLVESVKSDVNNAYILSDLNQRIFKLTSWKRDSGIRIVGRTHYLNVNYRTTKQISDYARYQFQSSEMMTDHIKDYKSIVNGDPPIVEAFSNDQDQKKYIVSAVKEQLEHCPEEQICVICPNAYDCAGVISVLQYEGIKAILLEKDSLPENGKGVCVCQIRGVKGLEFRTVIIYNYNNIEGNRLFASENTPASDTYKKLAECAKYVATTRARDELIITYIEKEA